MPFTKYFENETFYFIEKEWYPYPKKRSIFKMERQNGTHFENGTSIFKVGTQLKMERTKMESTKWNG